MSTDYIRNATLIIDSKTRKVKSLTLWLKTNGEKLIFNKCLFVESESTIKCYFISNETTEEIEVKKKIIDILGNVIFLNTKDVRNRIKKIDLYINGDKKHETDDFVIEDSEVPPDVTSTNETGTVISKIV